MIPVEESFAAWRKDPRYARAYNALDDEFARATAAAVRLGIEPAAVTRRKLGDFRQRSSD
jgi:hypothetical protein